MQGFGDHKKSQNKILNNVRGTSFKQKIINQAIQLHLKGNISEAIQNYKYIINQGIIDQKVF